MQIRDKWIDRDGGPFVLAEIGVNHNGDVGEAARLIEAAKRAGADGVKFQLFEAERLLAREAGLVGYPDAGVVGYPDAAPPPQPNHNVTPTHIEPEQYNP